MARRKRVVIPAHPHHVTQRGVRRQDVFLSDSDRKFYLYLLQENAKRYGVEVVGYCLMTNHVHHLMVPLEEDSLRWTMQFTHKRYADYINGRNGWKGHLWQQKFYSSPVDSEFFWITLRYIERNPVEAEIAGHAADYPWSSAKAHCGLHSDPLLTKDARWTKTIDSISDYAAWLSKSDSTTKLAKLRKNTSRDLPTGSEKFLDALEEMHGVSARAKQVGRPKKIR